MRRPGSPRSLWAFPSRSTKTSGKSTSAAGKRLTFDEIVSVDSNAVDGWARYDRDFTFPGGERIGDFLNRVSAVGDRLASRGSGRTIVFTHGGVIRALICHFLKLDPRNYLLFEVRPASVTTIRLFEEGGILTGLNQWCHLEGVLIWPVLSS